MTTTNTLSILGLPVFNQQELNEVNSLLMNTPGLVIFDAGVNDIQQLIEGIKPGVDWVVLNQNQDGIEQITRILANYPDIKTLHLVSHGAPGCLFLGNTQLNLETLKQYTNYLQSWSASDILLYGCIALRAGIVTRYNRINTKKRSSRFYGDTPKGTLRERMSVKIYESLLWTGSIRGYQLVK